MFSVRGCFPYRSERLYLLVGQTTQKQIDQMVCQREMVSMQEEFALPFLPTKVMYCVSWEVVYFRAIENHAVEFHHMEEDFSAGFPILVPPVVKARRESRLDIFGSLPKKVQYAWVW